VGLRGLKSKLKQFDYNRNGKLDCAEFEQALAYFGLFPKKVELQALMKYYDIDGDGNICYEEFLSGLRDDLTPRRSAMVEKAFAIMDMNGSQSIDVKDIGDMYDVSCHKDFIEGRKTKEQIVNEFLDTFDGARGNNDGKVSKNEWVDYYTDLSISLPSDDYFVQMMESTWGICEHEDTDVYRQTIAEYSRVTREQLITLLGKHNTK
jgi:Ca2+-binding EF-hand superfamily protein